MYADEVADVSLVLHDKDDGGGVSGHESDLLRTTEAGTFAEP